MVLEKKYVECMYAGKYAMARRISRALTTPTPPYKKVRLVLEANKALRKGV